MDLRTPENQRQQKGRSTGKDWSRENNKRPVHGGLQDLPKETNTKRTQKRLGTAMDNKQERERIWGNTQPHTPSNIERRD